MTMFLATNWSAVWSMTGMGIGIVFVILILLVLVLQIFTLLAVKKDGKGAAAAGAAATSKSAVTSHAPESFHGEEEEIAAAIAATLFLNSEEAHDVESGVITIVHNDHSTWHHFK